MEHLKKAKIGKRRQNAGLCVHSSFGSRLQSQQLGFKSRHPAKYCIQSKKPVTESGPSLTNDHGNKKTQVKMQVKNLVTFYSLKQ